MRILDNIISSKRDFDMYASDMRSAYADVGKIINLEMAWIYEEEIPGYDVQAPHALVSPKRLSFDNSFFSCVYSFSAFYIFNRLFWFISFSWQMFVLFTKFLLSRWIENLNC